LLSTRQACLSGALGFLTGEHLSVLHSCMLTNELVSFSFCLTFGFKRPSFFTPPSLWACIPICFFFFFFFFFLNQQFIMWCSNAVRGPIIQTVCTLRLRYALPVITQPSASGPPSGGQTQAEAHEYSNATSPFRAVKKSRPPRTGLRTQ
jgi:hypothetical protein